jgi:TFIIF-interacting CTD phosphatase-like protein
MSDLDPESRKALDDVLDKLCPLKCFFGHECYTKNCRMYDPAVNQCKLVTLTDKMLL